ncbi:DUF2125 domain-containing protein [Tabrizicola sp.]|uniref:DUF2125 domain-containing protein n=1 Tax=Tabrizicola sp. TaxID=2005166 RepID=UPI002FDE3552
MRKLLFLMVALLALWSGYWFVGSKAVRDGVNNWFADAAAQGLVAEKTAVTVAGYPNRFDLTVEGLHLADPTAGIGWTAPFVQVFAMTWKPWHIIAAFPPESQLALPDQVVTVGSEGLRASFRAKPALDLPLAAVILETNHLTASSTAGWTVGAGRSVASISADEDLPGAGDAPNTYVLSLDAAEVTPDAGFTARVNAVAIPDLPPPDLPDVVESLSGSVFLTLSAPLDRHAGEKKPYLTRLEVNRFTFAWGKLAATAKGQIEADDQGFAAGEIRFEITNWDRVPSLLVAAGLVKPEMAPTIARGMQALAGQSPDATVLPLTVKLAEGWMSFGPFPLGPAPRMVPPTG